MRVCVRAFERLPVCALVHADELSRALRFQPRKVHDIRERQALARRPGNTAHNSRCAAGYTSFFML